MGLIVDVYRNAGDDYDCSLNGISRRFTQLCVMNAQGPFAPSANCPAVYLALTPMGNARIVPADENGNIDTKKWYMFGGNYAASSDSRLGEAVKKLTKQDFYGALPIHDRHEG